MIKVRRYGQEFLGNLISVLENSVIVEIEDKDRQALEAVKKKLK